MAEQRENAAARVRPRRTPLPGRVRLTVDGLKGSPGLAERLEQALPGRAGIAAAAASARTGNLLVTFDEAMGLDRVIAQVGAMLDGADAADAPPDNPADNPADDPPGDPPRQDDPTDSPELPAPATHSPENGEHGPLWHCMSVAEAADRLDSPTDGLTAGEAEKRLEQYGPNVIATTGERSPWKRIADQFLSLPVGLLTVSAVLSVATGGVVDAVVIMSVVGLNAGIGYATEAEASRTIAALTKSGPRSALIIREGRHRDIPVDRVVIGDRLQLASGHLIGADARVTAADNLLVNEAALTGESEPVAKAPDALNDPDLPLADRANMVWRGTSVIGGEGAALVTATGKATQIGRIQSMVSEAGTPETPMQRELDRVGGQLVWLSLAVCGLVFVAGLARGLGLLPMLKTSISLAIAAVPEGLPTLATSTLALGVRDMRRRGVLVRKIDAVETLGSVNIVCLDKTGTLTVNEMTEVAAAVGTARPANIDDIAEGGASVGDAGPHRGDLLAMQETAALCAEIRVEDAGDGDGLIGSPTELAVVRGAARCGADPRGLWRAWRLEEVNQRTVARNYLGMLRRGPDGQYRFSVKGNPGEVLALCDTVRAEGSDRPLTEDDRNAIEQANSEMAGRALRVLGIAAAEGDTAEAAGNARLSWQGLIGLADPLRPGMKSLIGALQGAGLRPVIITGDQAATAEAIARELDLSGGEPIQVLESAYLDKLDPDALSALAEKAHVFARVSPAHKLSIVQSLQRKGHCIAMTGDGINDSPALKAADVGVALGRTGTDVARDVADIVLEDDELATLVEAVARGRTTYSNIRKAIRFLLATNLSEILVTLAATATGIQQPLTPMQLLWINLVTDILPAIGLALEPPEPDILQRPPRSADAPFLRASDFRGLAREAGVISGAALAAGFTTNLLQYGPGPRSRTVISNSLLAAQLPHALVSRSERVGVFSRTRLPRNRILGGLIAGSVGLQLAAVLFPPLRGLLGQSALGAADYGIVAASGGAAYLINEAWKEWAPPPAEPGRSEETAQ